MWNLKINNSKGIGVGLVMAGFPSIRGLCFGFIFFLKPRDLMSAIPRVREKKFAHREPVDRAALPQPHDRQICQAFLAIAMPNICLANKSGCIEKP